MPSPPDRVKEVQRKYRERHREERNEKKRAAYRADPTKSRIRSSVYRKVNRASVLAYNRAYRKRYYGAIRAEMIAAYGGACACCGESEIAFLQLDHIHGGGRRHVKEVGNSQTLVKWLKDRGWPKDDYRLLCANCNFGRLVNGGICPHGNL